MSVSHIELHMQGEKSLFRVSGLLFIAQITACDQTQAHKLQGNQDIKSTERAN